MSDNGIVGWTKAFQDAGEGVEILEAFVVVCPHCGWRMEQCDPKCVARLKSWLHPKPTRGDIVHNCPKCKKQEELLDCHYRFKTINRKGKEVRTKW